MHKKIVAVAFLFFVILVGVPTVARTGYSFGPSLLVRLTALVPQTSAQNSNDALHITDTNTERESRQITQFNKKGKLSFDSIKNAIKGIETRFDDKFAYRSSFVALHGLAQRLLSKRVVDDVDAQYTIIMDSHRRLHFPGAQADVSEVADALIDFHSFLSSRNIPFLYVQVPPKGNPLSNDMPPGITIPANAHNFDGSPQHRESLPHSHLISLTKQPQQQ